MSKSLAVVKPSLIKEWDYEKNIDVSPFDITAGSDRKVWWKCPRCGQSWFAVVHSRVKGHGCPFCSHQKTIKGKNDLVTIRPDVMLLWDYDKNVDLDPTDYFPGSGKKVWWKCSQGHSWQATISNVAKGHSCPFCAGIVAIPGENDLLTKCPDLAKEIATKDVDPLTISYKSGTVLLWKCQKCGFEWEAPVSHRSNGYSNCPHCKSISYLRPDLLDYWDYELNQAKDLDPNVISLGSTKRANWKCKKCGYQWESTIANMNKGRGCPNCNSSTSFPEQAVFYYVHSVYVDALNRYKINSHEFDIFIPSQSAAIEYDGYLYHKNKIIKERSKDLFCRENGIRLIRIREAGLEDTGLAVNIFRENNSDTQDLNRCITLALGDLGIRDTIVDVVKDEIAILSQYSRAIKENSFASRQPALLEDWDYDKNGKVDPFAVSEYSKVVVNWRCHNCQHEWKASVSARAMGKGKCVYCNSVANKTPALLEEWDYKENDLLGIYPDIVSHSSSKKVWWKCKRGHTWKTGIANRYRGTGCPVCAGIVARKIRCIENGMVFDNLDAAAEYCKGSKANTVACCKGRRKIAYGYHWEYVDSDE